jgi:hypothetical protein
MLRAEFHYKGIKLNGRSIRTGNQSVAFPLELSLRSVGRGGAAAAAAACFYRRWRARDKMIAPSELADHGGGGEASFRGWTERDGVAGPSLKGKDPCSEICRG